MQTQRFNGFIKGLIGIGLGLSAAGFCFSPSGFVSGPAGRIHYTDTGSGGESVAGAGSVPVIFLHSFAGTAEHWRDSLDFVRANRRGIAIDLRGHGRSDPGETYSIRSLADDVAAVIDALGLKRFVLVGHSMGGLVALECARRYSADRVAGLYLLDSGGAALLYPEPMKQKILADIAADRHSESILAYWETILGDATPALREGLARDLAALPRPAILGLMRSLFEYDPRPALAAYRGPIAALVSKSNDGPTALHRLREDIPVERVASENHWWYLDRPAGFHRHLKEFLEAVDRRGLK
ncbi:MAG: alpha/beta hydrolase [Leptospirales bacterium]